MTFFVFSFYLEKYRKVSKYMVVPVPVPKCWYRDNTKTDTKLINVLLFGCETDKGGYFSNVIGL